MINTNYEYYDDYEVTKDDILMIGERMRTVREQKELSRADLAFLLDMTADNLARIENGQQVCTTKTMIKICMILGVSADYLLLGASAEGYAAEIRMLFEGKDEKSIRKAVEIVKTYFS